MKIKVINFKISKKFFITFKKFFNFFLFKYICVIKIQKIIFFFFDSNKILKIKIL
jgi:hypothetical protein